MVKTSKKGAKMKRIENKSQSENKDRKVLSLNIEKLEYKVKMKKSSESETEEDLEQVSPMVENQLLTFGQVYLLRESLPNIENRKRKLSYYSEKDIKDVEDILSGDIEMEVLSDETEKQRKRRIKFKKHIRSSYVRLLKINPEIEKKKLKRRTSKSDLLKSVYIKAKRNDSPEISDESGYTLRLELEDLEESKRTVVHVSYVTRSPVMRDTLALRQKNVKIPKGPTGRSKAKSKTSKTKGHALKSEEEDEKSNEPDETCFKLLSDSDESIGDEPKPKRDLLKSFIAVSSTLEEKNKESSNLSHSKKSDQRRKSDEKSGVRHKKRKEESAEKSQRKTKKFRIEFSDSSSDEKDRSISSKDVKKLSKFLDPKSTSKTDSSKNVSNFEKKKNIMTQSESQKLTIIIADESFDEKSNCKKSSETSNPEVEEMFSCEISGVKKPSKIDKIRTPSSDKKKARLEKKPSEESTKSDMIDYGGKVSSSTSSKSTSTSHSKDSVRRKTSAKSESRDKVKKQSDVNPKDVSRSKMDVKKSEKQKFDKYLESDLKSRHDKCRRNSESVKDKPESSGRSRDLVSLTDLAKKAISSTKKSEIPAKSNESGKSVEIKAGSGSKTSLPVNQKKLSFEDEILKTDLLQLKKPKSSSSSKPRLSEKGISKSSKSTSEEVTTFQDNESLSITQKPSDKNELKALSFDSVASLTSIKEIPAREGTIITHESVTNSSATFVNTEQTVNTKPIETKESDLSLNKSEDSNATAVQVHQAVTKEVYEDVRKEVTPAENEALVLIKLELSPEPYEEITQPAEESTSSSSSLMQRLQVLQRHQTDRPPRGRRSGTSSPSQQIPEKRPPVEDSSDSDEDSEETSDDDENENAKEELVSEEGEIPDSDDEVSIVNIKKADPNPHREKMNSRIIPRSSGAFSRSRDGPIPRLDKSSYRQPTDFPKKEQRRRDSELIILDNPTVPKQPMNTDEVADSRQGASVTSQLRAKVPLNMDKSLADKEESTRISLKSSGHEKVADVQPKAVDGAQSVIGMTSREGQSMTSSCSPRSLPDSLDSEDDEGLQIDETRAPSSSSSSAKSPGLNDGHLAATLKPQRIILSYGSSKNDVTNSNDVMPEQKSAQAVQGLGFYTDVDLRDLMVTAPINDVTNSDDVTENQDDDSLDGFFVNNMEANVSNDKKLSETISLVPKLVNIGNLTSSSSAQPQTELQPPQVLLERSEISSRAEVEDILQMSLIDDDLFDVEDIEDSQEPSQEDVEVDQDLVDIDEPVEDLEHPISEEVEQQLRQILGTFCVDALELGRCTKQFCLLEHILSAKNIMDYYRIVRVANPRQLQVSKESKIERLLKIFHSHKSSAFKDNWMFLQFLLEVLSDLEKISGPELRNLAIFLLPVFSSFTAVYPHTDFKGIYQTMTDDEERSIYEALSVFIRIGSKLRQISEEKSENFLSDIHQLAAKRGLLLPDEDFKIILQNCCGKDLAELLVYRIYTPGSDILVEFVEKLAKVLTDYTNPSKVFLQNNARVLMSLDKKELERIFNHHNLQKIVTCFTSSTNGKVTRCLLDQWKSFDFDPPVFFPLDTDPEFNPDHISVKINSCIEEGHWAQLAYMLRSQAVDKTFDLSTFFRSIFESAALVGEDTGFVENVFQNFVDSLLLYQGVPVRQLPIIDRFLRQLWSTFLLHFSILQNTEKLMEIFDYGTTRLKYVPGCQAPIYYHQSKADFDTLKVKKTRFDILLIGIKVQVLMDNLNEAVALLDANGEDLTAQGDKEEVFQVAKLTLEKCIEASQDTASLALVETCVRIFHRWISPWILKDLKELSWKSRQEDVDSIVGDLFNKIVKTLLLLAYNKDDDAKNCLVDFVGQDDLKKYLKRDLVRSLVDFLKKDMPVMALDFYELGLTLEYYDTQQMDSWDARINIPMDATHFEIQMILEKTFEKIYYLITPGEVIRLKEQTDVTKSLNDFNATGINRVNFGICVQPLPHEFDTSDIPILKLLSDSSQKQTMTRIQQVLSSFTPKIAATTSDEDITSLKIVPLGLIRYLYESNVQFV